MRGTGHDPRRARYPGLKHCLQAANRFACVRVKTCAQAAQTRAEWKLARVHARLESFSMGMGIGCALQS